MEGEDNVDYPQVNTVEWFFGYGGNHLGLKRAIPGLRFLAVCERDAFVVANMVAKMEAGLLDAVPIWTDVTDFPIQPFAGKCDLFIASYPCQGFSHAGKRLGVDDHRHLWPYCRKFIQGARPGLVWLENVEGHITLGLSTVLADLAEDGYTAAWGIFSASEVGAPHQRKRVFILAYRRLLGQEVGQQQTTGTFKCGEELALGDSIGLPHGEPKEQPAEARFHAQRDVSAGGGENVADQHDERLEGGLYRGWIKGERGESISAPAMDREAGNYWPSRPGEAQYGWEPPRVCDGQTKPPLGGNADGNPPGLDFARYTGLGNKELAEIREWMVKGTNRTDELRMCGNGVVPATAERAFRVLAAELGLAGAGNAF